MPFSPEQMPQKSLTPVEETVRLKEKIKEAEEIYGRIRPHLAISWPLTPLRKEAFQMVQTGQTNENVRSSLEHHESPIERILWEEIDIAVKENAGKEADTQREKMLRLLASKNPVFASLETEILIGRLKTIEDIVGQLQKSFGEKLIGITVYGSTARGHMIKESDLDYTVIAYDDKIGEEFKKLLEKNNIKACMLFKKYLGISHEIKLKQALKPSRLSLVHEQKQHAIYSDFPISEPNNILIPERVSALAPLFSGLFFGDRNALLKLQLLIMEKMSPSLWDTLRMSISANASSLHKTQKRFNLTPRETIKMQAEISILRIPPPYQEALEFIRDQVKKPKKKFSTTIKK